MTTTFLPAIEPARTNPVFTPEEFAAVARFYNARPELGATPLVELPALARDLGVSTILAKDEGGRFGLTAFKLLGALYAIEQLLADRTISVGDTLVCASEGNHGRAVAFTARRVGCRARVYLSESVAQARADAIAAEGAEVVRVPGTYDDAVRRATQEAQDNGWTVISDTAWPGYERIPKLIMLGYTRLMDEVARTLSDSTPPDLIFVPGGVGGLLAAVAAWSAWRWQPAPRVVAVEPSSAACLQVSARAGRPTVVPGPFETMMGPLRCGEVSVLAFQAALPAVAAYIAIDDPWAETAMKRLARPLDDDPAVTAGPSGAAALGGLLATLQDPRAHAFRTALGISPRTSILLIVSEGMTDPPLWHRVVGDA